MITRTFSSPASLSGYNGTTTVNTVNSEMITTGRAQLTFSDWKILKKCVFGFWKTIFTVFDAQTSRKILIRFTGPFRRGP